MHQFPLKGAVVPGRSLTKRVGDFVGDILYGEAHGHGFIVAPFRNHGDYGAPRTASNARLTAYGLRLKNTRMRSNSASSERLNAWPVAPALAKPSSTSNGPFTADTTARMHQRVDLARHESVVDEEVLVHVDRRVRSLEIARVVVGNTVTQNQVLRSRGRTNRIGLHEAERVNRLLQRGRCERTSNRSPA